METKKGIICVKLRIYKLTAASVVSILPYAFAGNDNITGIILSKSLVSIGNGAFSGKEYGLTGYFR